MNSRKIEHERKRSDEGGAADVVVVTLQGGKPPDVYAFASFDWSSDGTLLVVYTDNSVTHYPREKVSKVKQQVQFNMTGVTSDAADIVRTINNVDTSVDM